MEEDRQPVRGRVDTVLEPAVPGLVVGLDLNEDLFRHGPLIRELEGLSDAFGKERPYVVAEEVLRLPSKKFGGLTIHVRLPPVLIKGDQRIADTFQDVSELLPAGHLRRRFRYYPRRVLRSLSAQNFSPCGVLPMVGQSDSSTIVGMRGHRLPELAG